MARAYDSSDGSDDLDYVPSDSGDKSDDEDESTLLCQFKSDSGNTQVLCEWMEGSLVEKVVKVLNGMEDLGINLTIFLDALSWHVSPMQQCIMHVLAS